MTFDELWPTLVIPGEFDAMDECDQQRWRGVLQQAYEAKLWPRDCRLCANFTTKAGGCVSVVQCVDGMQFKATAPRQYWIAGTSAEVSGSRRKDER